MMLHIPYTHVWNARTYSRIMYIVQCTFIDIIEVDLQ